ncbi:signal peptide peptidase SppA [bacterium]|nr:signal peptide peptidase SppA [bacterium]
MKKLLIIVSLALATAAFAQGRNPRLPDYGEGALRFSQTPGSYMGAMGAYWNPAGWAAMSDEEIVFNWNDRSFEKKRLDNWQLLIGGHGFGASMRRTLLPQSTGTLPVDDYQVALAGGDRSDFWGISYNWSKGAGTSEIRQHHLTVGEIWRPVKFASLGSAVSWGLRTGQFRAQGDLGLRPIAGSHFLTLFADGAASEKDNFRTMQWGAGAEIVPINGIRIAGKVSKIYADDPAPLFSLSLGYSIDGSGIHVTPLYDKDSERMLTDYTIRVGEVEPSFNAERFIHPKERVVAADMKGALTYQTAKYFDPGRMSLRETLKWIDDAKRDPLVGAVALKLSGFRASRELAWELRNKLEEFRASGKKVYVYLDNAGMTNYYLASCADEIFMDPLGVIDVSGWLMGRTYHKGMFEKLGLGVEEWRYFTYKSAFEGLARRDMSEKDKEQRMALLEDFHKEWSRGILEQRHLNVDSLRTVMDSLGILKADEALAFRLVDHIARWEEIPEIFKTAGMEKRFVERDEIEAETFSDPRWGEYPKIAVVYAIGECDLDTGIRGRYTSQLLKRLAKDKNIKAVVLRVDSPGGDGLASDWVAGQMKKVSEEKPMIVSQGNLAASGGYWLSAPADKVFTSPFTITGSIGVIAGWVWNEGLTDKTGLTYDKVQIGKGADLAAGVTLPLIGVQIPDRNVTDDERKRVEFLIKDYYDDFVTRVSDQRKLSKEDVESIAQGRVWSGEDALERQLVDTVGGLEQTVHYAKLQAGISPKEKVEWVEYPKMGWINWERIAGPASPVALLGRWFGEPESAAVPALDDAYDLKVLRRYTEGPGRIWFMLPPEDNVVEE